MSRVEFEKQCVTNVRVEKNCRVTANDTVIE